MKNLKNRENGEIMLVLRWLSGHKKLCRVENLKRFLQRFPTWSQHVTAAVCSRWRQRSGSTQLAPAAHTSTYIWTFESIFKSRQHFQANPANFKFSSDLALAAHSRTEDIETRQNRLLFWCFILDHRRHSYARNQRGSIGKVCHFWPVPKINSICPCVPILFEIQPCVCLLARA